MSKPKIKEVTGTADEFNLVFSKGEDGLWQCFVPPDTRDGMYAVTIKAVNVINETAFWSGFLYMCNGVCHLELRPERYQAVISSRCYKATVAGKKYNSVISLKNYKFLLKEPKYKMIFEERCRNDRAD